MLSQRPVRNSAITHVLETGVKYHKAGQFAFAEACYRKILQVDPRHAGALHLLGLVALQAEDSGTDATDAPDQSGTDDEGSDGLLKGLEELIWIPPDTQSTTRMDKRIRHRLRSMTCKQALETRGVRYRELLRGGCASNSLPKPPGVPTVRGVSRTAQL